MTAATSLILHGVKLSGHVHRVELLLRMLGLPYELVAPSSEASAVAAFKAHLNPMGQIPVLQDGELVVADSTAILVYLSKRYDPAGRWLPHDAVGAASVQRWLSIASGEIAYGPASLRAMALWQVPGAPVRAAAIAARVLEFMQAHLDGRRFLAAPQATIADLACYSYIAHAPEGGCSLQAYPAVRAWLAQVEALPGFVPLPASPLPVAA